MNRIILTAVFIMIVSEILLVFGGGVNHFGGPLFVEASLNRLDLNQAWKCADVIQNPDAVREELASRKIKGDHKIRKFIENCIKWGDGWRFKKRGQPPKIASNLWMDINPESSSMPMATNINRDLIFSYILWKNLIKNALNNGNRPVVIQDLDDINDPFGNLEWNNFIAKQQNRL